jgi:hypothetical protein
MDSLEKARVRQRRYKQKLKLDPERYAKYLKRQRGYHAKAAGPRSREKQRLYDQARYDRAGGVSAYKRFRLYNLSQADYQELLEHAGGRCEICRKSKRLHVDHCHETGQIRGLLCGTCNRGLGMFGDNYEGMLRVLSYLKKSAS